VKNICQQTVLELLQKNNKWMTARQIHEQAKGTSLGSVSANLQKLKKHKLIKAKESQTITKTGNKHPTNKYKAKTK
jgi:Fe2+ or Zn2+ uptake regulation protein